MATETSATGRDSDKFMLRFPDGMRARIKEAAERNGRTMNAEIIARLHASFQEQATVEQMAFEHGFEATTLKQEIERLNKLLEERKTLSQQELDAQSKAIAAEALKHLYAEAGETIEAARQAAVALKAAGKWPIKRQPKA